MAKTQRKCAGSELLNIYMMTGEPRKQAFEKFQKEKCAVCQAKCDFRYRKGGMPPHFS
ncbi:MAG: hypothetical protein PHI29_13185 [Gallionella sp.]|nr:hypothetical protein [Gallionella sp.]